MKFLTAVKKEIKTHITILLCTSLLLTLFYGLYLLIRVTYANYPEDVYYFEGGTPSTGQLLISGFRSLDVMVESLIISLTATILNYFITIKHKGLFVTSLQLTFWVIMVYTLHKIIPAMNFDSEYFDIFVKELKEEVIVLAILFFACSISAIGLSPMGRSSQARVKK